MFAIVAREMVNKNTGKLHNLSVLSFLIYNMERIMVSIRGLLQGLHEELIIRHDSSLHVGHCSLRLDIILSLESG